jgi:hypothetical protein
MTHAASDRIDSSRLQFSRAYLTSFPREHVADRNMLRVGDETWIAEQIINTHARWLRSRRVE